MDIGTILETTDGNPVECQLLIAGRIQKTNLLTTNQSKPIKGGIHRSDQRPRSWIAYFKISGTQIRPKVQNGGRRSLSISLTEKRRKNPAYTRMVVGANTWLSRNAECKSQTEEINVMQTLKRTQKTLPL
jgi:hypothetical protein